MPFKRESDSSSHSIDKIVVFLHIFAILLSKSVVVNSSENF